MFSVFLYTGMQKVGGGGLLGPFYVPGVYVLKVCNKYRRGGKSEQTKSGRNFRKSTQCPVLQSGKIRM